MRLNELLRELDVRSVTGDAEVDVTGVHYDSRRVEPGSVFVAIRGEQADGNAFVPGAGARGAVAVVSEKPPPRPSRADGTPVWIQVRSARGALAALAAGFYKRPTAGLRLAGITGTNGKTTTAYLVESILEAAGLRAAVLGTIGYRWPGFEKAAERTTPEAPDLERMFRQALEAGCRSAVMEVSSHAIAMKRVEQLEFDVVAFTNLSGEHLDFHGGMREYFEVKKRLFTGLRGVPPPFAVINRDDPVFGELSAAGNRTVWSFGLHPDADLRPLEYTLHAGGIGLELASPAGKIFLKSPLLGRPNLYNITAAAGVALAMGVEPEAVARGVAALGGVPGRFESVACGQPFQVIVDYAHTDDALAKLLGAVRELGSGRVILVFGAGGDRDISKRARMGEVAAEGSDFAVVTSDNPRSEDPARIIAMVEGGLGKRGGRYVCCPDRREAIRTALERAVAGDIVVIAGKGHETCQITAEGSMAFDDRVVARELLDELAARRDR